MPHMSPPDPFFLRSDFIGTGKLSLWLPCLAGSCSVVLRRLELSQNGHCPREGAGVRVQHRARCLPWHCACASEIRTPCSISRSEVFFLCVCSKSSGIRASQKPTSSWRCLPQLVCSQLPSCSCVLQADTTRTAQKPPRGLVLFLTTETVGVDASGNLGNAAFAH